MFLRRQVSEHSLISCKHQQVYFHCMSTTLNILDIGWMSGEHPTYSWFPIMELQYTHILANIL